MAANELRVRFEPPDDVAGIPLEDVESTLHHVRMAVRETVWHLGGDDSKVKRRPPVWVVEQSALKVFSVSTGSLVIDLGLAEREEGIIPAEPNHGPQALEAVLDWKGPGDPALPGSAAEHLESIGADLSPEVKRVRLTDWDDKGSVTILRKDPPAIPAPRRRRRQFEPARAQGLLMEVNWRKRTAQLHPTIPFPGEGHISLQFDASLSNVMHQYATRFVTLKGKARLNENDEYEDFHIEEIIPTRGSKPFTREELEEALARARVFRREELVRCSEPFDVEGFIHMIHEARDV